MARRVLGAYVLLAALGFAGIAAAQTLDALKGQAGGWLGSGQSAGGASLLSGLGSGAINPSSAQNVAGVLGYCQQQGYLKSGTAAIKDKLLGKFGGQPQVSQDAGYQQGLGGILQGGGGKRFDLSSLKGKIGEQVCKKIGEKAAASFLGG
jgi:hypothetical protein